MKEFMMPFIGTKLINATPMTRGEYNDLRGWDVPEGEDPADSGMLIEYEPDSTNTPNVKGFDGYVSWSPSEVFDKAYNFCEAMDFGQAIFMLRRGNKVARQGWNGKDMFIFLVPGSNFIVNRPPLLGIYPEGTAISYHAHIDMKTANGDVVPWLASQSDMLAHDWYVED